MYFVFEVHNPYNIYKKIVHLFHVLLIQKKLIDEKKDYILLIFDNDQLHQNEHSIIGMGITSLRKKANML